MVAQCSLLSLFAEFLHCLFSIGFDFRKEMNQASKKDYIQIIIHWISSDLFTISFDFRKEMNQASKRILQTYKIPAASHRTKSHGIHKESKNKRKEGNEKLETNLETEPCLLLRGEYWCIPEDCLPFPIHTTVIVAHPPPAPPPCQFPADSEIHVHGAS